VRDVLYAHAEELQRERKARAGLPGQRIHRGACHVPELFDATRAETGFFVRPFEKPFEHGKEGRAPWRAKRNDAKVDFQPRKSADLVNR